MAALEKTRTVFQLDNIGSWFENIAVRANGRLLATRIDLPQLWEIDPASGDGAAVVTWPAPITSVTGITELTPDIFAVAVGQYDGLAKATIPGTYEIHTVDFGSPSGPYTPRLVTAIPEGGLINGITKADGAGTVVLAADSEYGVLYRVDVAAKSYDRLMADELMRAPEGAMLSLGINGVKVRGGYIYFSNSMRNTLYRVPVESESASFRPTGPIEPVASGFMQDDFCLDEDGTAYVTTHPMNTVVKVAAGSSEGEVIAGNLESLELAGSTACAFGRGSNDKRTLYVSCAGALAAPVKGEQVEPAKIVAIDLS
ncbi:hypothetical protein B0T26DRAFT_752483 [Lasiosphaeria miniovina]|uniref:Gluconolactonase n=1 Tax=Lasiosphaeria miniovina TaxID=1954250 RepID=A0AA40AMH1_9PEZI|nr:uncharacterized protein B0T26DRAFT_752483 [Lasiosphaeria miniovina]KAK0718571.1 hypothetical protein B0T26DRAFT_752483 [Lasiosphaeria miniovina]